MAISTAELSDALREVQHNLDCILAIFFPLACGHGCSGRRQKDKRVVHAFRLTGLHKNNKLSVGNAQPMLTRVGWGGWIVAIAGPGLVFEHTMS